LLDHRRRPKNPCQHYGLDHQVPLATAVAEGVIAPEEAKQPAHPVSAQLNFHAGAVSVVVDVVGDGKAYDVLHVVRLDDRVADEALPARIDAALVAHP
jgi:hypothetical protein